MSNFVKYWTEVGKLIANGGKIGFSELHAIYDDLSLYLFKKEFLPGTNLVGGTVQERKDAIFNLAEKIWGLTPSDWLAQEKAWLDESRQITGSTDTGGKDKISDVISAEILLSLIAAARLAVEDPHDRNITGEAITAINVILAEVCTKGRTRMSRVDGQSVYSILKHGGLMVGTGGGKYLPNPEKSLPQLLIMLDVCKVRPEVYIE